MIAEFVDSNVLVYAFDFSAGLKRSIAGNLLKRLDEGGNGGLSTQVLTEFYSVATRKLGMASVDAEQVIRDLAPWALHRPDHAGVLRACELHRRFGLAW